MYKGNAVNLLWQLDIGPKLTGYRYLLRALEQIRAGEEISPRLISGIAEEFGVSRNSAYSALKTAQKRASAHSVRQYEALMDGCGDSLYDFLYALSGRV